MRVLQVNLCRTVGGSSFHHADLALGLKERGHQVLVADRLGDFTSDATGGAITHWPMWRGLFHLGLWRAIRTFAPDLIHTHQSLASRVGNQVKGGVPLVATIHGAYKARSYGRSDAIIRVAEHQQAGMAGYAGPSMTVRNWLRPTAATPGDRHAARAEFGIALDAILFGTVCRIVSGKGVPELIAAFRQIPDSRARLLIVGDGKDMAKARAAAGSEGRIIFTGHRPDAQRLMQAIDVFILNSRAEAYPLALVEAAAAGCAIVTTDTLGARELLKGQPVTTIPVDGIAELTAAMRQALDHPPGRIQYDLSGFDRARQIDATTALYRDVLAARVTAETLVGASA